MTIDAPPRISASRGEQKDLTIVTVEGSVTADQVREHIVSFLTSEPTRLVLWDLRRGSLAAISSQSIQMIVSAGAPHAHRRQGGRTAIVSSRDLDFGLSRMFQTIAELEHVPFEIRVFRDLNAAMAWLRNE